MYHYIGTSPKKDFVDSGFTFIQHTCLGSNDEVFLPGRILSIVSFIDDYYLNIALTDEGIIMDYFDPNEELLGTRSMTFEEWAEVFVKGH